MINQDIMLIAGTAAAIGFFHTLIGPDHYLPFIVIARARGWRLSKTLFVSFLCGLGHVLSSVALGFLGIALGMAVFRLEDIESFRGGLAAWLLIGFGLAYMIWGIRRAVKNRPHTHPHWHSDGAEHDHLHRHGDEHAHLHERDRGPGRSDNRPSLTPWVLFAVFVFGPCEPLIPMIMYPAARHSTAGVILVAAVFGATTILTMLAVIALSSWGMSLLRLGRLERYVHALAGGMIFVSGLGVKLLGL
jgi:ABC-type nickel/cobalt efflux system permease component RcnA